MERRLSKRVDSNPRLDANVEAESKVFRNPEEQRGVLMEAGSDLALALAWKTNERC